MNQKTFRAARLFFLVLSLGALACDLGDVTALLGGSKPDVAIVSPPSGSIYHEGEDVAVQSTSSDSKGIARVELIVDGTVVRSDPSPTPQQRFSIIQTWKATQGAHTISVRAYNGSNAGSDPAAISINVAPGIALNATPTLSAVPTSGASGTPVQPTCTNDAVFIADVTVPSGTVLSGGQAFNKIWRVQNNGTCIWGAGYDFALMSGEAMGSPALIAVPNTAPGATADLLVALTAPASAGVHSGQWRLRTNATPFGATLNVSISVPAAPPPCPGPPVISSFTASPPTINAGGSTTLNWGAVTNATSASIDHNIGGVATPGSKSVSPSSTTTYVLTATGCGGVSTSQVTITVNPVAIGNFEGHWVHNFGWMDLTQSGVNVTGTYHNSFDGGNGSLAGIVTGNTLNGTYQKAQTHPIQFTLGAGGNTFDGNWATTNQWCGARSGVAFPAGCGYSGQWNISVLGSACTTMTLTQVDTSASGTYCGTSVTGSLTYNSTDETVLTGYWGASSSNLLKFFLQGYNGDQFRGNWSGTNFWCGWRASSSKPAQCKEP